MAAGRAAAEENAEVHMTGAPREVGAEGVAREGGAERREREEQRSSGARGRRGERRGREKQKKKEARQITSLPPDSLLQLLSRQFLQSPYFV